MLTVKIDEDRAIDLLLSRLEEWTQDSTTYKLYEQMYESYVYGGCFDGGEFDVAVIVDNDYVNYCEVVTEGDEYYKEVKRIYDEQGLGDCSCESDLFSYIEAEYNGAFLVRW